MPDAARRAVRRSGTPSLSTLPQNAAGLRLWAPRSSASIRKKKELIGNFKNPGRCWCQQADPVLVHDWPQDALGQALPYGIYDMARNHGYVVIGDCFDTPRFAVEA